MNTKTSPQSRSIEKCIHNVLSEHNGVMQREELISVVAWLRCCFREDVHAVMNAMETLQTESRQGSERFVLGLPTV